MVTIYNKKATNNLVLQLQKPNDVGYECFWVDFNTGSRTMSFSCNNPDVESQGEDLWETVVLDHHAVDKHCVQGAYSKNLISNSFQPVISSDFVPLAKRHNKSTL